MDSLREQIKAARQRAYSLKTKKAQRKAWDKVHELERELFRLLCEQRDRYARFSVKGTVISDNSHCMSDTFGVDTPNGIFWVSPTCDELSKSWYSSTCCVEYSKGQEVIIEMEVDVNHDRLTLHAYPKRVYGGILNETKYAELCKKGNLAFFKYPDGHMSGLFAQGRAE
jgi:hypothetical protein